MFLQIKQEQGSDMLEPKVKELLWYRGGQEKGGQPGQKLEGDQLEGTATARVRDCGGSASMVLVGVGRRVTFWIYSRTS